MNKKILKVSNIIMSILLGIMCLISVASIIFILLGNSTNFDYVPLVYMFLGVFFAPLEYLINGTLGSLDKSLFVSLTLSISIILLFLTIFAMVDVKRMRRRESNEEEKKYSYVQSIIFSTLLFAYLFFGLLITLINYTNMASSLTGTASSALIIYIIFSIVGILISLLFNVALFLNKNKKKNIKIYGTTNFYSREYEEVKNDILVSQKVEEQTFEKEGDLRETKKQAKDLILKIMQLDELKRTGQISEVEYTRLRQKAIKRYKV